MLLGQCAKCDHPVTDADLNAGHGAQLGDQFLCQHCSPEPDSHTVTTEALGFKQPDSAQQKSRPETVSAVPFDQAAVPIEQSTFFKDIQEQQPQPAAAAPQPSQPAKAAVVTRPSRGTISARRSSGRMKVRRSEAYGTASATRRRLISVGVGFCVTAMVAVLCLYLVFRESKPACETGTPVQSKDTGVLEPRESVSRPSGRRKSPEKTEPVRPSVTTERPRAPEGAGRAGTQIADAGRAVFPPNDSWRYLAGSDPPDNWMEVSFSDSKWSLGRAGFGYGDSDDRTELEMRGKYTRVYIRHAFDRDDLQDASELGLMIRYDDAFIAYLNGKEVIRAGVKSGRGADATGIQNHEARNFQYFLIKDWKGLLQARNMIAIEGHNKNASSSDFTLDPYLVVKGGHAAPKSTGAP